MLIRANGPGGPAEMGVEYNNLAWALKRFEQDSPRVEMSPAEALAIVRAGEQAGEEIARLRAEVERLRGANGVQATDAEKTAAVPVPS